MGHLAGKDLFRKLGKKIDGLIARAPWNETFYQILKELYTAEEAEVVIKMPYGMCSLKEITRITKIDKAKLRRILDGLSEKGLVIDVAGIGGFQYMLSPLIVGIFEFTMMRTRGELNSKEWGKLFHSYLQSNDDFYKANLSKGEKVSPLRALPHEGTIAETGYVEILDYEKASAIIEDSKKFAVGICSCRHEKLHSGEKECDVPLENCSTFGQSADYMIRHGFSKEVSKTEMLENLERSKEMRLVLNADNVKNNVSFICHCCGCCCNVLLGISKFGYPNSVVTSNYIAGNDPESCTECGNCVEACPIDAVESQSEGPPQVNESLCMGCGVCALDCPAESMRLNKRKRRVLHPENTFERVILQSLEHGTLQNLMFNNPQDITHKFMRGFVGAFLKLSPVKKALIGDTLRSSFLRAMTR